MGDGPPSPETPRRIGPFRRVRTPGGDMAVGEVDPNDPWVQKGAEDTGGALITGEEQKDRGILTFRIGQGRPEKPDNPSNQGGPVGPPESTVKPIDPNHPHLIRVAGGKLRKALADMPAPPKNPR